MQYSYGKRELVSFFMSKFDNLSEHKSSCVAPSRQSTRENRSPRTLRPPYITFQIISRQNDGSTNQPVRQPGSQAAYIRIVPVNFSKFSSQVACLCSPQFSMANYGQLQKENPRASFRRNQLAVMPKTEKRNTKNRTKNKNSQLANIPSLTGWLPGSSYTQIFGYTCLWAPTSSLLVGAKVYFVSHYNCYTVNFHENI